MKLTHHWVADIFPLNDSDVDRIAADIKANGQRQPIIVWQGAIVDGRTRFAACKKLGIDPMLEEYKPANGEVTDDELLALSWSLNESRRHLTTSQRACAAAEVSEHGGTKHGGERKKGSKAKNSSCSIAERFTVGHATLKQAIEILRDASELFQQVKRGELTVGGAYEAHQKTKELQRIETAKNNLAALRDKNQDLAEQVEDGKLTMDEAQSKLNAEDAAKRERISNLGKIGTGVFVALATLKQAREAMDELKSTVAEMVSVRPNGRQMQQDISRIEEGVEMLSEVLKASKAKCNLNL